MNIEQLKQCIRPWIQVSTWNSSHPLDQERFHRALHNSFLQLGLSITYPDFETAVSELAAELYPNWDFNHRVEIAREYAIKAESIATYLSDTEKL